MPLEFLALAADIETTTPAASATSPPAAVVADGRSAGPVGLQHLGDSFKPTSAFSIYSEQRDTLVHFGGVGIEYDGGADTILYNLYQRNDRVGEWNVGLGAADPVGPGLLFGASLNLDFDIDDY